MKYFLLALVALNIAAQQPGASRAQMISDLQEFTRSLGFQETGNFRQHKPEMKAHYRCYYTGKLTLPDSYEGLRLAAGSEAGCSLDEAKYDVFFYRIEAVASGEAPVTESMNCVSDERAAVVVAHEDFHEAVLGLPPRVGEAASTLLGFLSAAEFAKARFGESSEMYRNLRQEAELFRRKAELICSYHEKLSRVYAEGGRSPAGKAAALARKKELFDALERDCLAIEPEPHSFNRCPAVFNNAGLAFDMTYARYYPLLYDVYLAHASDLRALIATLKKVNEARWRDEEALERRLREIIK